MLPAEEQRREVSSGVQVRALPHVCIVGVWCLARLQSFRSEIERLEVEMLEGRVICGSSTEC